jgi:erythromycin esterase-like protein
MTLARFFASLRRRFACVAAVAFCAVLAACSDGGTSVDEGPPEPSDLPAGVHDLVGITTTLGNGDLEPLRGIVGTARFVALGESTHTSAGFYQAKFRLIRFMVEQMGFRVVFFESNWLEGLAATRYVETCAGTPEDAVASLFPVWRDAHVRDLLRWMCDWNLAHPGDRVTFLGFDVQEPWRVAPALREFVQRAAPAEVARTEPIFRCLGASYSSNQFFLSQEYRDHAAGIRNTAAHQECMAGIAEMEAWIAANSPALQGATSVTAVEEARLMLVSMRGWEDQLWIPEPGGYQGRDFGMATAIQRLHALHTPGKKAVIWAWNWHIARRYEEVRGFDDDPQRVIPRQGARAMGGFLTDAFGADYLPIGLIGYDVQINSGGVTPPLQTHPESVERRLHDLGRPYLLVDLRQPLPQTLLPPGRTYRVSQEWGDPYRQFGALVYLHYSPGMTYVK